MTATLHANDQHAPAETLGELDALVQRLVVSLGAEEVYDEHGVNLMLASLLFVSGAMPYHRDVELTLTAEHPTVLPAGATVLRQTRTRTVQSWLLSGSGWIAAVKRFEAGSEWVAISAIDEATATAVVEALGPVELAEEGDPNRVEVVFMHLGRTGPVRNRRKVIAKPWAEIRQNYVPAVADRIDSLVKITGESLPSGRVLLLHGPPGTGKTTLLRAIALGWADWCTTHVVVDPEELFGKPGYLFDVILGRDDDDDRWTLLVLEDCDELLRAEAKERSGQALSRLLNVADGLVGQGLRVLVCLTTNEPVQRLHPALRRPGRCLAELEVSRFSRSEAGRWLGAAPPAGQTFSLAELIAYTNGTSLVTADDDPSIGQYL